MMKGIAMAKLHRIIWIDAQIRADRFPNARTIAQEFEISQRQAARDLEYLRDSLGAPIDYCAKMRGYYYAETCFTLPNVYITDEQKQELAALSQRYDQVMPGKSNQLAELFRRLAELHPSRSADKYGDVEGLITHPFDWSALPSPAVVRDPYWMRLEIAVPEVVEFSNWHVRPEGEHIFCIEALDYRELILFLLACPCPWHLLEPNWLRLRFYATLERVIKQLSNE